MRVPMDPAQRIAAGQDEIDQEQREGDEEEAELFEDATQHGDS